VELWVYSSFPHFHIANLLLKLVIELLCLTNILINLCVVGCTRESLYKFGQ
jgi:hypothetical protein